MSIQDDIKKQKQINSQKSNLAQQRHQRDVAIARKKIPEIVDEIKRAAVDRAAREDVFETNIHRGGLFFLKRYMKVEVKFSSDSQHYFYLRNCPEIYGELVNAINATGLKNTYIIRSNYRLDFIINTEIDLN